jgi:hypothetical protein
MGGGPGGAGVNPNDPNAMKNMMGNPQMLKMVS